MRRTAARDAGTGGALCMTNGVRGGSEFGATP
jgi:hypothetical protein